MIADERGGAFFPSDREVRRSPDRLREAHRNHAVNDHLSWINSYCYQELREAGVELEQFNCPNRNDNFNYLKVTGDPLNKGGAWVMASKLSRDGQTPVTADLSEQATWAPEHHCSYSHGGFGLVYYSQAQTHGELRRGRREHGHARRLGQLPEGSRPEGVHRGRQQQRRVR